MGAALILTIFPILLFSTIAVREAIVDGRPGAIFAVATILAIALVAWIRFLTMEKYLEDRAIGPEDQDMQPPIELERPDSEEPPDAGEDRIAA